MAEFSRLVITNKGQALLAKMMTGEADVEFTKISVSDKEYTLEELNMLTELTGVKQTAPVAKITRTNNVAITIETSFDNTELTQGYYMRALGLYAIDPDDGEILYAVTTELAGCCYMPAYNGITISGACIKLVTTVGNAENVSLEVDPGVYATVGEIKELRESVDGIETWKDSTQKRLDNWGPTIVGHGQVINSLRDSIGNLKPVATSGDYNDLSNRPSIPAAVRVKGNAESSYRTGDVNLTAENIGAFPITGGEFRKSSMDSEGNWDRCNIILPANYNYWDYNIDERIYKTSRLTLGFDEIDFYSEYYTNQDERIIKTETKYNLNGIDTCSHGFYIGTTSGIYISSTALIKKQNTSMDLGSSTSKWNNVYATNGIIQTSDRNRKNTIKELASEKAKALIYGLNPSTYQMNEGTSGRTHWGLISQDIEKLFEEIGMTSLDFAGYIKSPKIQRVTEDENGKILQEPIEKVIEGKYDYSLRYDEFIAPIIKVIQSQHEEIETLKQETAVLRRQLSDLMKRKTV